MAKKYKHRYRKPTIPTPEQDMFIRKSGLDPYQWLILWDGMDTIKIMHRETKEKVVLEK
jgi:hypothetical protein